jgi:hypothetical protein
MMRGDSFGGSFVNDSPAAEHCIDFLGETVELFCRLGAFSDGTSVIQLWTDASKHGCVQLSPAVLRNQGHPNG